MLDGLEIFKALTHLLPFEPEKEDQYKPTAEHNQGKSKEQLAAQRKADETNYYTGKYFILCILLKLLNNVQSHMLF